MELVARNQDNQPDKQNPLNTEATPSLQFAVCKTLRYPILLGDQWGTLPQSIQKRFVKWTQNRKVILYQGRLLETRFSKLGRLLSSFCWLIGNPLPDKSNIRGPATVIVRECRKTNGQIWTRIYPRKKNVPQVIQSLKRFEGETGLEEMITKSIGIALTLEATPNRLNFISDHYFVKLGNRRIKIPAFLTPGRLCVSHKEAGPKRFRFSLTLTHKFWGELIFQTAIYEEIEQ
ncbi:hypothetical protein NBRC116602_20390 [Hyphomicrobiales bacterium 4NK60-0047b]